MTDKMIFEIIKDKGYEYEFNKILVSIKRGKLDRDEDDINAEGFWNFTYDLGFNCDTGENEKMYEIVYNKLWEIAEKVLGEK